MTIQNLVYVGKNVHLVTDVSTEAAQAWHIYHAQQLSEITISPHKDS